MSTAASDGSLANRAASDHDTASQFVAMLARLGYVPGLNSALSIEIGLMKGLSET
jgi:hypothetical protein